MAIKQKKTMTNIDISVEAGFLRSLLPFRIVNIYDAPGGGVVLKARSSSKGAFTLVIEPGKRVHLTRVELPRPRMPSPFVMGLRKQLRGKTVTAIEQLGFDRVVIIRTSNASLVAEILPRGVLVLVDNEGKVVYASKYMKLRDRSIKRSAAYQPPPNLSKINPLTIKFEDLAAKIRPKTSIVRGLVRGLLLPGEFIEEVLHRAGIPPTTEVETLPRTDLEKILSIIKETYKEALTNGKGYILLERGTPITVTPFEPRGLSEAYGFEVKEYTSFDNALDEYFTMLEREEETSKQLEALRSELEKLKASYTQALERLGTYRKRLEEIEKKMITIGENMELVYSIAECLRERKNCPYVRRLKGNKALIEINGVEVELGLNEDPSYILVVLEREAGELRAKIKRAERALEAIKEKIEELKKREEITATRIVASIRRREWYERYHWIVTTNGFLAIGGRNADQNEAIVKRYLTDKDIFMHADIRGAPIVVFFARGRVPPLEDLREAAVITAAYSRAWKEGLGSVDVYWVWGNQVSKSPPPGEYLVKGSFMVYGKRNYIRNVEIKLALGVGVEDNAPIIVVGPLELVKRRTIVYALIVPGELDKGRAAKALKKEFLKRVSEEYKPLIDVLRVEEIIERLPGPTRILGVFRGDNIEPPRGGRGETD